MTLAIANVVVNCEDPHRLAEFWTRALGMTVVEDYGTYLQLAGPGSPVGLGLQRVPDPRTGPNRVHVDLHGEPRDAAVARLAALGATVRGEERPPGLDLVWTVLTDPEGNEFCIGGEH